MKLRLLGMMTLGALLSASAGDEVTERATDALRRALGSSAEWTMSRRLGENGPLLVSSGRVDCVAQSGIVWRVSAPFASSVAMTTNAMIFTDEEGVRTRALSDLPHYAEIRSRTDAFVLGDRQAFDGLFELTAEALAPDGWRLKMQPKVSAMERMFSSIELTGGELPTNAVLRTGDGGIATLSFRAVK